MAATFASIKAILRPVLTFMKDHKLWDEPGLTQGMTMLSMLLLIVSQSITTTCLYSSEATDQILRALFPPTTSVACFFPDRRPWHSDWRFFLASASIDWRC